MKTLSREDYLEMTEKMQEIYREMYNNEKEDMDKRRLYKQAYLDSGRLHDHFKACKEIN